MKARERISKTIISVMDRLPFYSELMMRSKILEFPEAAKASPNFCPSMAVAIDGNIYYDEEFVNQLDEQELTFVILHESLHKAYLHLHRIGNRDPLVWNIAADIFVDREVVQELMQRQGLNAKIPGKRIIADYEGTIHMPALGVTLTEVHTKTVEQIYEELLNNPEMQKRMVKMKAKAGADGEGNSGALGDKIDSHQYTGEGGKKYSEMTEAEKEELAESAKDDVIEAATKCKKRGTLPKHLERMLNKLLDTKIDWRQYVWRHVVNELPYDYSLSRPSRRYLTQGMYLPGVTKENLDVVALIDLSGSISDEEMSQFVSLMTKLANQFKNVDITIVAHDTEVQAVTEIKQATHEKIKNAKYEGGGGTDHRPAFKWVQDNKRNAPLIIVFTDGYTCWPRKEEVKSPTIVVITRGGIEPDQVPFGTAVKIEDVK
jgi:predicted metal-dependent peptidase